MPPKAPDLTPLIWATIKPLATIIILLIIGTAIYAAIVQYLKNRGLDIGKISNKNPYSSKKPLTENQQIHHETWTLELIQQIEWRRFEELTANLMNELGFHTEINSFGADGGIDIKIYKEGSNHPDSIIQCKAWNKPIGIKPIREFLGVITHQKIPGIFITTGIYTKEVIEFSKENKIDLVDGKRFLYMIKTLTENAQKRLLNKTTEGDYITPTCASCGIKMIKKTKFWGCTNYPRCRQRIYFKTATN